MAILDSLPEFKVSILSGDVELKEYDEDPDEDSTPEPNTVVKFFECQDGAPFSFHLEKEYKHSCYKLDFDCYVDGNYVGGVYFAYKYKVGEPET